MLIRLLPEQVSNNWDKLAPLISVGLSAEVGFSRQGMANVLRSILAEDLVCWAYEDSGHFIFLLLTQVKQDIITLDRQLLIWSLSSIRNITNSMLKRAFVTLSKYAKHNKCRSVIGYVNDDRLIRLYREEFNADTDYTFVEVVL